MLHLHQITHKLHLAQIPNLRSRTIGKEVINKIHPKIKLKQKYPKGDKVTQLTSLSNIFSGFIQTLWFQAMYICVLYFFLIQKDTFLIKLFMKRHIVWFFSLQNVFGCCMFIFLALMRRRRRRRRRRTKVSLDLDTHVVIFVQDLNKGKEPKGRLEREGIKWNALHFRWCIHIKLTKLHVHLCIFIFIIHTLCLHIGCLIFKNN